MPEPVVPVVRRIGAEPGAGVGLTVHEFDSGFPGPHVLVLGGVHGDEVGGIVAAGRLAATPWRLLRGRLSIVPVTHEAAHAADARVSPLDGLNLARTFPGSPSGTPTEALAWLVTHRLIARADVLVDLHTSNAAIDMPLFVGCVDDGSPHGTHAAALARGFGLDVVWSHPGVGPGRSLTVAHERGIPSLYVESPDGGVLDERHLSAYVDGVASVLGALGMVVGSPARRHPALWLHGDGDTDTFSAAPASGLFQRSVRLLDAVRAGDEVGRVLSSGGEVLATVPAPIDGHVTTLQRSAAVTAGQPTVGVTPRRPRILGLPSDDLTSSIRRTT
jgi:predicted deacylase